MYGSAKIAADANLQMKRKQAQAEAKILKEQRLAPPRRSYEVLETALMHEHLAKVMTPHTVYVCLQLEHLAAALDAGDDGRAKLQATQSCR